MKELEAICFEWSKHVKKYDRIPVKFLTGRLAEFCGVDFNFFSKMKMEGIGKAGIILNCEYTEDELLKANTRELKPLNSGTDASKEGFSFHFSMQEEDQESYHHTYQEERRITRAVEEGRTEDAVRLSMAMDDKMGMMGAGYLDDIAEKMGISPTYLSRLFSKEKGMPLQEYVLKVRVDRAANLLTYSDSSIAEIGDYVNFPSQSYFGRVFKKYTGLTPKQYRNAHKPREFTV